MNGFHMRCSHIIQHRIRQLTILRIAIRAPSYTTLSLPPKLTYTYNNYAEKLKQRLRATQQVTKSHINEAKIKAKMYADKDKHKNLQNRR